LRSKIGGFSTRYCDDDNDDDSDDDNDVYLGGGAATEGVRSPRFK